MDDFSFVPSAPITHHVELYTSRFFVEGKIAGPFKRTSDLLNRSDSANMMVQEASITPLGQTPEAKRTLPSLIVVRAQVHFAASYPQGDGAAAQSNSAMGPSSGREYYVQKMSLPCYALTDTFVIYGSCYLHPGTTLQNLLDREEPFMPLTNATIYPVAHPAVNWRRELVVVNKSKLEVIYVIEA